MGKKRFLCMTLACAVLMGCLCTNVGAVGEIQQEASMISVRASGKFDMDIPGNEMVKAGTSFPLEKGEEVRISAIYSPRDADIEFGLLAPDGFFYPENGTDGSIDWTIRVSERGEYTLAVRNNSSDTVSVSGYVTY